MKKTICRSARISLHPNVLWLFIFAIGMGVFLIRMPKYHDDCLYLNHSGDWLRERGVVYLADGINIFIIGMPWEEIKQTLLEHWSYDNMRFANVFVIPFLFMPKYIGSSICLIAWLYTIQ